MNGLLKLIRGVLGGDPGVGHWWRSLVPEKSQRFGILEVKREVINPLVINRREVHVTLASGLLDLGRDFAVAGLDSVFFHGHWAGNLKLYISIGLFCLEKFESKTFFAKIYI